MEHEKKRRGQSDKPSTSSGCRPSKKSRVTIEESDSVPSSSKRSRTDSDTEEEGASRQLVPQQGRVNLAAVHYSQLSSGGSNAVGKLGVIQKIFMRNFMCHTSLEITLNPRINFVVGRNGSGKSAILSALVLGLGGSSYTTKRGTSLKQFMKHGTNCSVIEITLDNGDKNRGYKYQEFGDKIIVTRKLTESGSSYTIKGSSGKIIFTRREDLDRIINYFNIQLDNPISILNQDTARTFLNNTNPREKYQLFMRATQLQKLWDIALSTIQTKDKALLAMKEKRSSINFMKKEIDSLELRWNQVRTIQGYRKKIAALRDELNWAVAVVEEQKLATLQRKKDEFEEHVVSLRQVIDNGTKNAHVLQQRILDIQKRINDIREEAKAKELEYEESKEIVSLCKKAYVEKLQSYKGLGAKCNRHQENISSLHSAIKKLQGQDYAKHQEEIGKQIEQKESKYDELAKTLKTVDLQLGNLRLNENKYKEDLQQNGAIVMEWSNKLQKVKHQITTLQKNSSNKLAVYGHCMPVLVEKINEAVRAGRFKKPPIGPVGAYIQVKDSSWAPAIEYFLGLFLKTFCIDNYEDHLVLHKIVSTVYRNEKKPMLVTSKYLDTVHDVRKYATSPNLLDALIITNPVIANCLIDHREIETILLIPTSKEAMEIMKHKHLVPRNCRRAITKRGEQFYPDPDFRSYCGKVSSTPQFIQVNMENIILTKQEECKNIEKKKADIGKLVQATREELKKCSAKAIELKKEKTKLQQAMTNLIDEINTLKESNEPETTSITTLQAELEESSLQLQAIKNEEKALAGECENLKCKLEAANKETQSFRKSVQLLQSKEQPLLEDLESAEDECRQSVADKTYQTRKLSDAERKLSVMVDQVAQQQKDTAKAIKFAEEIHGGRIETKKTPATLDKEIKALEKVVNNVEKDTGDYTAVGTELNTKKDLYQKVVLSAQEIELALNKLDKMLEGRKQIYTKIQRYVCVSVNQLFAIQLRPIGFSGEVKIDHAKKELVIEVQPSHRSSCDDIKTLSGGERSYSTVGFIMALWEEAHPPFYFLDEFDVFMDKVNRRKTLDMLVSDAKMKKDHQFVFLTPQDLSNIVASPDITIHKMENPREEN